MSSTAMGSTPAKGSSNNNNFGPGVLQFGGYATRNERSTCEIAEVVVFNRELNQGERVQLEGYLFVELDFQEDLLDMSNLGEFYLLIQLEIFLGGVFRLFLQYGQYLHM